MSQYVDGFVIPIAKDRVDDYRRLAEKTAVIWKEYGALEYWECIGDDIDTQPDCGLRSFLQLANASPDETVIFAWVVFESRETRDAANAKICSDSRLQELMKPENQIFDNARMACGGFRPLVRA